MINSLIIKHIKEFLNEIGISTIDNPIFNPQKLDYTGLTAEFGLSNGTDETATFQRTVIKNSRSRCLVIPSSKIGVDSFIKVCDVDAFDSIITDWDCVEDQIAAIEERGVEITVVEEPK